MDVEEKEKDGKMTAPSIFCRSTYRVGSMTRSLDKLQGHAGVSEAFRCSVNEVLSGAVSACQRSSMIDMNALNSAAPWETFCAFGEALKEQESTKHRSGGTCVESMRLCCKVLRNETCSSVGGFCILCREKVVRVWKFRDVKAIRMHHERAGARVYCDEAIRLLDKLRYIVDAIDEQSDSNSKSSYDYDNGNE